jgi:hypothetical protein
MPTPSRGKVAALTAQLLGQPPGLRYQRQQVGVAVGGAGAQRNKEARIGAAQVEQQHRQVRCLQGERYAPQPPSITGAPQAMQQQHQGPGTLARQGLKQQGQQPIPRQGKFDSTWA